MKDSKRIVSRNGNQGGSSQARLQPVPSLESVGYQPVYVASVGAREKSAAGVCSEAPSSDPRRRHGGQASSPGLFGLRVNAATGSPPAPVAVRPAPQASQHAGRLSRPLLYRLTVVLAALCEPDGQPVINPDTNCSRLARTLEVSPRTVQRDMDFLRDSLCLPIQYEPGRRTFYLARPAAIDLSRLLVFAAAAEQKGGA